MADSLPSEIEVTFDNDSSETASVSWEAPAGFDQEAAGAIFLFSGLFTAAGIQGDLDLQVRLRTIVFLDDDITTDTHLESDTL